MVVPYLLDVNVLLALAWQDHMNHQEAHQWFDTHRAAGFATCPLTQLGFVRISSNQKFTRDAVSPATALHLLERITRLPGHRFWSDSVSCHDAFRSAPLLVGHKQITDFYLLHLAQAHGGVLATLDRRIPAGPHVAFVAG